MSVCWFWKITFGISVLLKLFNSSTKLAFLKTKNSQAIFKIAVILNNFKKLKITIRMKLNAMDLYEYYYIKNVNLKNIIVIFQYFTGIS